MAKSGRSCPFFAVSQSVDYLPNTWKFRLQLSLLVKIISPSVTTIHSQLDQNTCLFTQVLVTYGAKWIAQVGSAKANLQTKPTT